MASTSIFKDKNINRVATVMTKRFRLGWGSINHGATHATRSLKIVLNSIKTSKEQVVMEAKDNDVEDPIASRGKSITEDPKASMELSSEDGQDRLHRKCIPESKHSKNEWWITPRIQIPTDVPTGLQLCIYPPKRPNPKPNRASRIRTHCVFDRSLQCFSEN